MNENASNVLRFSDCDRDSLVRLLARHGLTLEVVDPGLPIDGSYWGDEEAGLVGTRLVAREDTPIHSILHEACHFICMDETRRTELHTNAGGGHDEENGVCYLQVILADELPWMGRRRMLEDMDAWGYSFRLGSARSWFERDAGDAREWLIRNGLLTAGGKAVFTLRK